MKQTFSSLALGPSELVFGRAKHPIIRNGVSIGSGSVLPEIKFTLSSISIEEATREEIRSQYSEMITDVCQRAVDLHQSQLVVEFELLPQMTVESHWGVMITELLKEVMEQFRSTEGLQSLLRVTPTDTREFKKPPLRREGRELEDVLTSFRTCANAGGDLLSIESTGGKEVTDQAIMETDVRGMLFGVGVLAAADMEFLWERICEIAHETATIPAGDTACGIANTAMVLADKHYIPKVFAAVVRAMTAVRSLIAYEAGAIGPGKDCGYENAYIKAITGFPMSMEGKSAACAHLSTVGNIAGAYTDLWSNESVQNVKLLSAMAPVVSMEQLIYDCRLFNTSLRGGKEMDLRDLLVDSDSSLDPQAFIFRPEIVQMLSATIIAGRSHYEKTLSVALATAACLDQGVKDGTLLLSQREQKWLHKIAGELADLPTEEGQFIEEEKRKWLGHVDLAQYGLPR
ncbi:MAG TPA: methanol--corrinoid methyltransferase [Bacteroidetes bacterium]|nr:methanol--corrinoid methyltransferase [Bacteroidota bacterium]